ncbi:MAG: cell division protein FtsH [Myxococcales bacterium SG8_38]|nr:MAG: cell division protein FtsH [Myxococcales bacterium SG8_38]
MPDDKRKPEGTKGRPRLGLLYLLVAIVAGSLLLQVWESTEPVATIPYSEFERLLEQGKVKEVVVTDDVLSGELTEPIDGKVRFSTNRVDHDLAETLQGHGVEYSKEPRSPLIQALASWLLPLLLLFGFWIFLSRRMAAMGGPGAGLMSVGKSKAKVYMETDTRVSFSDVAGVDEAKEELEEVVAFLKDPQSYGRLGARMPRGILLIGPPGTGKTLLARAVAGEAGVPFFSISGSEFVEMFVGVGAARVRDLFDQARQQAPCIIFVDELDALGRARNAAPFTGGTDEKEQTLNQLLVEMDGFDPSTGIVLLAATNRPEILDPALLRAGRFDRQVLVDRPDRTGRTQILKVHAKKVALDSEVEIEAVAGLTPGFTGADLANLVNEAAIVATRRNADAVSMEDFTAAIERIVAGLEKKNRLLNPRERTIVAYHEMGHALVALMCERCDKVHKVSIIPRGVGALGYTMQRPTEDRFLMTREELEEKMAALLGGRAAEQLVFGHLSTGAADDLAKVTDIARSMVMRYAMVPELGHITYESQSPAFLGSVASPFREREYSDDTAREIDNAVRTMVDGAFKKALTILREQRAALEEGAQRLLENETLGEEELQALYDKIEKKPAHPCQATSEPGSTS